MGDTGWPNHEENHMATPAQIIAAARVAHEANRAYCETLGDHSQVPFDDAPDNIQQSALDGVTAVATGAVKKPGDSHANWLAFKERDGWKYGPVKDPMVKEHPSIRPFEELDASEQMKDHLFVAVVTTLLGSQL
jgi:hypothetical protein